ncbi:MAG: ferrous iron transport protein B [Gammaproteobacteria bacterium]|nr:ferrous iron transport protein B [Gammaproteobacteria bacterium]
MKRIALIGMPNAGKSTLFNRMSGANAKVANWPGVTVDLLTAKLLLAGEMTELVDLPGIYDLHGFSDDEQIVRHFLCNNTIDLVLIVANASQVDRQLSLALQLRSLGLPAVLLLNMSDEAKNLGITINTEQLSQQLGYPTALISAKYGQGYSDAYRLIETSLQNSSPTPAQTLEQNFAVDQEMENELETIVRNSVDLPTQISHPLTEKLDKVMLHPILGLPLFFVIMYMVFQTIYTLGAPLQDLVAWLLEGFRDLILVPLLSSLPALLSDFLINGVFDGIATVASFVPVIILFFLMMAVVEDSGYLSRAAFLMDALMTRMGLDGRSFVMLLMGFGCNVPALMGTRTMRSRGLRLLTMLVIPFSLCSARLQVFVFMATALFAPSQAPLVLFSLYIMSFVTVIITALLFKGRFNSQEPFALELPPYRFPTSRQMFLRGWHEISHFLHRATKFITIGVVLVWILTNMPYGVEPASSASWSGWIGDVMSPILSPAGINPELTVALIFGFVAKEIVIGALAVIYGLEGTALMQGIAQQIDWVQAYSFMLFTLIYTPCLSTIATLRAEAKSAWFTTLALVWPMTLAWSISAGFYQMARYLGY